MTAIVTKSNRPASTVFGRGGFPSFDEPSKAPREYDKEDEEKFRQIYKRQIDDLRRLIKTLGERFSVGTFNMTATASLVVNDALTQANSKVFILPTNSAGRVLQAGANAIFVSTKTAGTSFTVVTAGGGAAAGTETFEYLMVSL